MFKLTFLGTSAGMPTKARNVSALAIECVNPFTGNSKQSTFQRPWVLVDCGEGTQHQLLHTPLSLHQLAAICITHVHGDHCYGLPGILASMAMASRKAPLTLIAPQAIQSLLQTLMTTTQLQLSFTIQFIAIERCLAQDDGQFQLTLSAQHELTFAITALSHRVPSYSFAITQTTSKRQLDKDKLHKMGIEAGPIWGTLQAGEDVILSTEQTAQYGQPRLLAADFMSVEQLRHKIVVAGDNDNPQLLREAVADAQLLVHEATYSQQIKDRILSKVRENPNDGFNPMHTSAQEIAQFAQKMAVENIILTHFSARYQLFDNPESNVANMAAIRLEVEQFYDGNCWLARDFARFSVDKVVTALNDNH